MQLLHSRGAPGPEFVGVSLLLKGEVDRHSSYRIGEPFLLPGPLSTVSHTSCAEALKELHQYLSCMATAAAKGGKESSSSRLASTFFQEDEQIVQSKNKNQVYRPAKGRGVGLHYRIIRERSVTSPLIKLVLGGSKTGKPSKQLEKDVTGVVVCVGIAGLPSSYMTSSLYYSITQRMDDSIEILSKNKLDNTAATTARSLLGTLLLTDDDDRLTNSMAEGASRTILSQEYDVAGGKKKKHQEAATGSNEGDADSGINSADQARLMVERLAVLSVTENDTIFRKFEAKEKAGEKTKTRRRKTMRDADLDGFDFKGEKLRSTRKDLSGGVGNTTSVVPENSSVKSLGKTSLLKQPQNDTKSRSYGKQRTTSVPALLASSKDSGARNIRRASVAGGASVGSASAKRGSRRSVQSTTSQQTTGGGGIEWSFDGANGNKNFDTDSLASGGGGGRASGSVSVGSRGSRSQQQQQQQQAHFDPFASNANSVGDATASTASETTYSTRKGRGYEDDQESAAMDSHFGGSAFGGSAFGGGDNDDQMTTQHGQRSSRSLFSQGSEGSPRVQVNVALNEDLTCFYKLSKMSSCAVEGVVQVQVKSNIQQGVPFFLLINDPSGHIQSIQENKKFAENMAEALMQERPSTRPDYKFSVSVPKADNYFPVMRYKCGTELRPVPIRVQTRVRLEDSHWRVALQISSNPHNEDNLTDLTIIMGVPPVVRGESLTTSPPGGVWNASKRSVIWCVSELGGGEKFQLQARFEIDPDVPSPPEEKPKFPVLVRCQCMYAQLSDVEVEVRDIPEVFAAEVKMKLARRFRLSHRERP